MSDHRNTAITYRYRDGSNYKVSATVIFAGAVSLGDRDRLIGAMMAPEDEELWGVIIPGQIGLQDLQNQFHVREVAVLEALLAPQDGPVRSGTGPEERSRLGALLGQMRGVSPMWRDDEDHIFHDVTDITLTDQDPTDPRSILDLIAEMEKVVWDLTWLPSFHAQMVANLKEHLHTQQMSGPDN